MNTKLFVLLLAVLWNRVTSQLDYPRDATRLLDTLFDSKKYDRRVRPNFGVCRESIDKTSNTKQSLGYVEQFLGQTLTTRNFEK
uniref:Uncharacterized protein n=1 Tax=Romanomermis culicivorax TaxID=13658 RepID=A0A915L8T5_ROMCU